jgi:hypothetical protein
MVYIKNIISFPIFFFGYLKFQITKKYDETVYQCYVRIYCFTDGKISEFISFIKSLFWKKKINYNFNKLTKENFTKLRQDGYTIIEDFLSGEEIQSFLNFSKNNRCKYIHDSHENLLFFEKNKCHKPTYNYVKEDILNDINIKKIIKRIYDLGIAQNYLHHHSYLIDINMWWSTVTKIADTKSAQEFHFDLDSIKWLKFFIYLTDVNLDSGPHIYVKGTHKSKDKMILKTGYQRVSDKIIQNYYSDQVEKIFGKKGTLIIGDTSCFHKGAKPEKNERLVFELTLANDLFGCKNNQNLNSYFEKI